MVEGRKFLHLAGSIPNRDTPPPGPDPWAVAMQKAEEIAAMQNNLTELTGNVQEILEPYNAMFSAAAYARLAVDDPRRRFFGRTVRSAWQEIEGDARIDMKLKFQVKQNGKAEATYIESYEQDVYMRYQKPEYVLEVRFDSGKIVGVAVAYQDLSRDAVEELFDIDKYWGITASTPNNFSYRYDLRTNPNLTLMRKELVGRRLFENTLTASVTKITYEYDPLNEQFNAKGRHLRPHLAPLPRFGKNRAEAEPMPQNIFLSGITKTLDLIPAIQMEM